jgi:heme/copper-type cytochrome/quinol oxidase subunit 2
VFVFILLPVYRLFCVYNCPSSCLLAMQIKKNRIEVMMTMMMMMMIIIIIIIIIPSLSYLMKSKRMYKCIHSFPPRESITEGTAEHDYIFKKLHEFRNS